MGTQMKDRHRKLARKRFWTEHEKRHYSCPGCGRVAEQVDTQFEVHHIDGDAHNNSITNLVAYCRPCHCIFEGRKPSMRGLRAMVHELGKRSLALDYLAKHPEFIHELSSDVSDEESNRKVLNELVDGCGTRWSKKNPQNQCRMRGCRNEPVKAVFVMHEDGCEIGWWTLCENCELSDFLSARIEIPIDEFDTELCD